ncbi:hypothetical protein ACQZV8_13365 [Magnetococcales bacterium HHB-1]
MEEAITPATLLLESTQLLVEQERRMEVIQIQQRVHQEKIDQIKQRLQSHTGYTTALNYCRSQEIASPLSMAPELDKAASERCSQLQIRMGNVPDKYWGSVKTYPVEVLQECLETLH